MIVVDASVVVAALLSATGAGSQARERLRRDTDVHVPHLLDVEVTAAVRRLTRLGQTRLEQAEQALTDLGDFAAFRWDHAPLLRRAWALRENVTVYGAMYVALAEALDAPMITSDARLSQAPGLQCRVEVIMD